MTNNRHFLCFDFETSSKYSDTTQILQIGACVLDRHSYTIKDEFETLVRPEDWAAVEDEALKVNGLTREQLKDAPDITVVFPMFTAWVNKYNVNKAKNSFGAPISIHFNGDNFDMPILSRYCKRFGHWDEKWGNQTLVNPIYSLDVLKHLWFWMRGIEDVPNLKLVTLLEYMGVSKDEIAKGAHNALWDVRWTARIAVKLLKAGDYLTALRNDGTRRLEMKDCFKGVAQ
jgi:DNA polymerase III epsilon subunit-like protein